MVTLGRTFQKIAIASGLICTVAGGIVLWKDRVQGKDQSKLIPKNLDGKVYLVTGANSGIGKAITYDLARRKAKVFMLCRDMVKCEETRKDVVLTTKNKYVYCRLCDVASQKSIREFVSEFKKVQNRVDGLVNNAGIMKAPRAYSPDGVEIHWATNHLGHFLLTYLLLDLLKSSAPSRIVFLMNVDFRKASLDLTDLNMEKHYNKSQAFSQSQLANMLLVQELAERLAPHGVTCNAVYPGIVSGTDIKRYMGVDKSMSGRLVSKPLLSFATRSAEKGAQTVIYVLLEESLKSESGKLFSNMQEKEIEGEAKDMTLAKKLFLIDEYWTGIKNKDDILNS